MYRTFQNFRIGRIERKFIRELPRKISRWQKVASPVIGMTCETESLFPDQSGNKKSPEKIPPRAGTDSPRWQSSPSVTPLDGGDIFNGAARRGAGGQAALGQLEESSRG